MRKLLASTVIAIVAAAGVLASATPASAGLGADTYDAATGFEPNQQFCQEIRDRLLPPFGHVGQVMWEAFVTCRQEVNDAVHTLDDQAICVITEAFADGFEQNRPTEEPFVTVFTHTASALRTADQAYCHGDFRGVGDVFEVAPKPRSFVPPGGSMLYDLPTAFPCAFTAELSKRMGPHNNPVYEVLVGTYHYLDCDENQLLPEDNRL